MSLLFNALWQQTPPNHLFSSSFFPPFKKKNSGIKVVSKKSEFKLRKILWNCGKLLPGSVMWLFYSWVTFKRPLVSKLTNQCWPVQYLTQQEKAIARKVLCTANAQTENVTLDLVQDRLSFITHITKLTAIVFLLWSCNNVNSLSDKVIKCSYTSTRKLKWQFSPNDNVK